MRNKKYYINKIKGFVLHMTCYEGEWCHGFNHKYQLYMRDVIPGFIIFETQVNDSVLEFFGYDEKLKGERYIHNAEEFLTRRFARKIYRVFKKIDLFYYSGI